MSNTIVIVLLFFILISLWDIENEIELGNLSESQKIEIVENEIREKVEEIRWEKEKKELIALAYKDVPEGKKLDWIAFYITGYFNLILILLFIVALLISLYIKYKDRAT
jgi:hypothetical protein